MTRASMVLTGDMIALAAGAVAVAGLAWMQPPPPAAPSTAPVATAEVIRGSLVDTKTVTGTLSYGELSALRPSLADDAAMVTWMAPVGSTVERGEPLYALDGQPAILFYGAVPQHRTLRFDPDRRLPVWVELEQSETAVDGAALRLSAEVERLADAEARVADLKVRLEDALSNTPATPEFIQPTGAVRSAEAKVDRVTELSAAALAPTIDVASAQAELVAARAALDAGRRALRRELATADLDALTARVDVAEAEMKLGELRSTLETRVARAADNADVAQLADNLTALGYAGTLPQQVRAWQAASGLPVTGIVDPSQLVIAESQVHIAAHSASVGETLVASSSDRGSLLGYSSVEKLVSVPLGVGDRALATIGNRVTITLPGDKEIEGTISKIGSVVTDGAIEVIVTIADQAALGGIEVASVDVAFVSEQRDDVLSVPVAALLARPDGGFAVEVMTSGASSLVPVETGLFAAGRVEISGADVAEGMRVGVPG